MNLKPFTPDQQKFISAGEIYTKKMREMLKEALGISKKEVTAKRHTYIQSPPGAGKTYTTQLLAKEHKVPLLTIQGASSMNGFVLKMVEYVYAHQMGMIDGISSKEHITVWVDDCDSLFMESEALNVMKGALDQERNIISWNKNLTVLISTLENSENAKDNFVAEALRHFQSRHGVGLEVPTDMVRFLITSNLELTAPSGKLTSIRKRHEAAIRDRVAYKDFTCDAQRQWGWVAYICLNAKIQGLNDKTRAELLTWMWDNWSNLPATSMRAVTELAAMVTNYKDNYRLQWDLYLL